MMLRALIATTLASGLLLSSAGVVYAQVTDQTDQSEEDWRKSRKKSGNSDIFNPNNTTIGTGLGTIGDIEPVSPVERLPSESRRHLMRERAKAIAESADGDISDAEYEPSEAAKNDEALMRDEKEAWEVITTDMEGAGGQADTPSEGGPNKVAVTGRNGTTPAAGSRGGSTATLAEIMAAIKAGQMGNGSGSGNRSGSGPGTDTGTNAGTGSGTGDGDGQASDGRVADGGTISQGQAGGTGDASGSAQGPFGNQGASSAQGQSDGQGASGSQGQATSGSDNGSAASAANGQDSASGRSGGTDSATGDANSTGQDSATRTARSREDLSPLERMRQSREEREATGSQRSASDYLGSGD